MAIFFRLYGDRAIVDVNGPVKIDGFSVTQPDLMLLAKRDDDYRHATPGPGDPLLVVEVALSSLRYDRGRKLRAYARTGVAEVWIVNLVDRRLERYTDRAGGAYATVEVVLPGASIAPRAFPHERIAIDDLLP